MFKNIAFYWIYLLQYDDLTGFTIYPSTYPATLHLTSTLSTRSHDDNGNSFLEKDEQPSQPVSYNEKYSVHVTGHPSPTAPPYVSISSHPCTPRALPRPEGDMFDWQKMDVQFWANGSQVRSLRRKEGLLGICARSPGSIQSGARAVAPNPTSLVPGARMTWV